MAKYMVLFQTGPVQEFIQTARKTQDFWSGSFLLSFLNAKAIRAFGESDIIFPNTKSSKICEAAGIPFPWKGRLDPNSYVPSIPNRFFAVTTDHPKERLEKAANAVTDTWQEIAGQVRDEIERHLKNAPGKNGNTISKLFEKLEKNNVTSFRILDSDQWDEQIRNRAFETLYVWREYDAEKEEYIRAYQETEALMGARKSGRFFEALGDQKGYACSLCGLRMAINPRACKERSDLRDWWENAMRGKKRFPNRFRKGEHLCAVCAVKRLAPFFVFKTPKRMDVPSTSTMSAISFQRDIQPLTGRIDERQLFQFQTAIRDFRRKAVSSARRIKEPRGGRLPPFFRPFPRKWLLQIDGDWFFDSFYEHHERRIPTKEAYQAWKNLEKLCVREHKLRPPSKYFALLTADGDSMGEILSELRTQDAHRQLSNLLADFSVKKVRKVLEQERPGYILYWGGDEGVAILPLEDLFNALTDLRKLWHDEVEAELAELGVRKATLSAGVVIAHHQYPLRSAIRELYKTVEEAKETKFSGQSKDAWAVRILRRSGAPVLARSHWEYEEGFQPLVLLNAFQEVYRDGWLSPAWLSDLEAEKKAMADPPPQWGSKYEKEKWCEDAGEIFKHEADRLLRRHADVGKDTVKKERLQYLVDGIQQLNTVVSSFSHHNFQRHSDLCAIMDLANYVAKGGGR
ncbi:MAG: type III-B CRISPR-associated protein Cas10/Cmr2 [Desulfobacteraceae bacterium 4572_88]|nr:MAG: type III-B CRISPR-associated protein Cas10/Cmr2 [Desulfobacteraceae bacterium 4572_88]